MRSAIACFYFHVNGLDVWRRTSIAVPASLIVLLNQRRIKILYVLYYILFWFSLQVQALVIHPETSYQGTATRERAKGLGRNSAGLLSPSYQKKRTAVRQNSYPFVHHPWYVLDQQSQQCMDIERLTKRLFDQNVSSHDQFGFRPSTACLRFSDTLNVIGHLQQAFKLIHCHANPWKQLYGTLYGAATLIFPYIYICKHYRSTLCDYVHTYVPRCITQCTHAVLTNFS